MGCEVLLDYSIITLLGSLLTTFDVLGSGSKVIWVIP